MFAALLTGGTVSSGGDPAFTMSGIAVSPVCRYVPDRRESLLVDLKLSDPP